MCEKPRCTYRVLVSTKPVVYVPCTLETCHKGKCRPAQLDGADS